MRSESLPKSQTTGLAKGFGRGIEELQGLMHDPGRGRRQYRDQGSSQKAVNRVIEEYRLAGLIEIEWKTEEQREMRYVGRRRGGTNRQQPYPIYADAFFSLLEKRQQGGIDLIRVGCAHSVWKTVINLQRGVLHQFGKDQRRRADL